MEHQIEIESFVLEVGGDVVAIAWCIVANHFSVPRIVYIIQAGSDDAVVIQILIPNVARISLSAFEIGPMIQRFPVCAYTVEVTFLKDTSGYVSPDISYGISLLQYTVTNLIRRVGRVAHHFSLII